MVMDVPGQRTTTGSSKRWGSRHHTSLQARKSQQRESHVPLPIWILCQAVLLHEHLLLSYGFSQARTCLAWICRGMRCSICHI